MQVIPVTAVHQGFGRPPGAMPGGPRLSWCSSVFRRSSSTRRGRRSRTRTTHSARTLSPFYSPEICRRLAARVVRAEARLVAGVAAVLAGAPDPAVPRPLPLHLLLLPRRLLQGVLGRSAVVRRRRAAHELLGRALVPADPAERPPLLHVGGARLHRCSSPTTSGWRMWFTDPATGATRVRHRRRHARASPSTSCCSRSYTWAATSLRHVVGGRLRRGLEVAGLRLRRYACVERAQRPAQAVRLVQPVLGHDRPTSTSGSARWAC